MREHEETIEEYCARWHRKNGTNFTAGSKLTGRNIFSIVNLALIIASFGAFIWAAFDIHQRLPIAMLSQIPCLICMGIRRALR